MADEKNTETKAETVNDLADLKDIAADAPEGDAAEIAQNADVPLREQELDVVDVRRPRVALVVALAHDAVEQLLLVLRHRHAVGEVHQFLHRAGRWGVGGGLG